MPEKGFSDGNRYQTGARVPLAVVIPIRSISHIYGYLKIYLKRLEIGLRKEGGKWLPIEGSYCPLFTS